MYGKRLKTIRSLTGLKQKDLAEILGVSGAAISKLEAGINAPSASVHANLLLCLNVNLNWFITGKGSIFLDEITTPDEH